MQYDMRSQVHLKLHAFCKFQKGKIFIPHKVHTTQSNKGDFHGLLSLHAHLSPHASLHFVDNAVGLGGNKWYHCMTSECCILLAASLHHPTLSGMCLQSSGDKVVRVLGL